MYVCMDVWMDENKAPGASSGLEFSPLRIGGSMYICLEQVNHALAGPVKETIKTPVITQEHLKAAAADVEKMLHWFFTRHCFMDLTVGI